MEGRERGHVDEFADYSAAELLSNGLEETLAKRLGTAKGLNLSMAERLAESGYGDEVVEHWQRFGADADTMLRTLVDNRAGESALDHLDRFHGANLERFADHLLETGKYEAEMLVKHIDELPIDRAHVLERLLSKGYLSVVAGAVDKFPGLDQAALKERLLHAGYSGALALAANMNKFTDLDAIAVADELIAGRRGEQLSAHIGKFPGIDHDAAALKMAEGGDGFGVIAHLDGFTFKDADAVMRKLIEKVNPVDIEMGLKKIMRLQGLSETLRTEIQSKFEEK